MTLDKNSLPSVEPAAKRTFSRRDLLLPFLLVASLFFIWGFCHAMLDVLNKHFQNISACQQDTVGIHSDLGFRRLLSFGFSLGPADSPDRVSEGHSAGAGGRGHRRLHVYPGRTVVSDLLVIPPGPVRIVQRVGLHRNRGQSLRHRVGAQGWCGRAAFGRAGLQFGGLHHCSHGGGRADFWQAPRSGDARGLSWPADTLRGFGLRGAGGLWRLLVHQAAEH